MDKDEKRTIVLAAVESGSDHKSRLSCAAAFALSEKFGITLEEIGLICDEARVKISGCQLGCFR